MCGPSSKVVALQVNLPKKRLLRFNSHFSQSRLGICFRLERFTRSAFASAPSFKPLREQSDEPAASADTCVRNRTQDTSIFSNKPCWQKPAQSSALPTRSRSYSPLRTPTPTRQTASHSWPDVHRGRDSIRWVALKCAGCSHEA